MYVANVITVFVFVVSKNCADVITVCVCVCVCCTSITAKGTRLQFYKYINVSNNHSETSWSVLICVYSAGVSSSSLIPVQTCNVTAECHSKQRVSHSRPFCFYRLFIAIGSQVTPSSKGRAGICSSFTFKVVHTKTALFKTGPKNDIFKWL